MLATALSLAVPAGGLPATAHGRPSAFPLALAKKKKNAVTPEVADAKRVSVQQRARGLSETDPVAAGVELDNGAAEWGDPVLFMDAAEAYLQAAEKDRDEEVATAAIERARIALDILYYHLDDTADPDFRLVAPSDVPGMINRAESIIERAQAEIEEIRREAELATAPPPPPAPEKKKRQPSGPKAKIIPGAVLATAGGGLLAMGATGLVLGAVRQNEAEDPTVYGKTYDAVEKKGKQANLLAGVGLGVGGAVFVVGVVLIAAGKRQQKKEGSNVARVRMSPTLGSDGGGLSLTGRF